MITLLLWILAATLNAFMDIVENENFSSSRFSTWNPKFWYKRVSWEYAARIFGYKFDAWHLAKSGMIISLALSAIFYKPLMNWYLDLIVLGMVWNGTFTIMYKLFKK